MVYEDNPLRFIAAVQNRHHGNFAVLDQVAQGVGQVRGGAAGGVSRLWIHAEDIPSFQYLADGADEVDIIGKFSGADSSDPLHEPGTHIVAVDVDHVVDSFGIGQPRDQLEVDEGHMVGEEDVGRLDPFHADLLQLVVLPRQKDPRQNLDEPGEVDGLADGVFGGFVAARIPVIDFLIHMGHPPF